MIGRAGFIGIVLTNSVPVMAAPGSRGQIISNAPFSYGVPVKTASTWCWTWLSARPLVAG